jgi:phenylalanine-4-hydroxylase
LALDYGFIEPNADRHAYTLTLDISESDPFFDDKLDIAESNGFAQTAYFDIFYNRPLPPGMITYLRLVALGGTDAFLLESLFRDSIWGHLELPVSRDNEELLCKAVRDACKSALAGYHTTIEQVMSMTVYSGLIRTHARQRIHLTLLISISSIMKVMRINIKKSRVKISDGCVYITLHKNLQHFICIICNIFKVTYNSTWTSNCENFEAD